VDEIASQPPPADARNDRLVQTAWSLVGEQASPIVLDIGVIASAAQQSH